MLERLKNIIVGIMPDLDVSSVNEETLLSEDLHFDSLAMMMLAMAIEDEFNVSFKEPKDFKTVKDVIEYINYSNK